MKRTLKTTTALLASVNLAMPLPALAQAEAQGRDALARAVEACALDSDSADCQTATEEAVAQGVAPEEIASEIDAEASAPEQSEAPAEAEAPAQPEAEPTPEVEIAPETNEAAPVVEGSDLTDAVEATDETDGSTEGTDPAPVEEQTEPEAPDQPTEAEQQPAPEAEAEPAPQTDGGDALPSEDDLREGLSADPEATAETVTEPEVAPETTEAGSTTEAEATTEAETMTEAETAAESTTEATATDGGEAEGELPSEDDLRKGLSSQTDVTTEAETTTEAVVTTEADGTTEAEAEEGATAQTDAEAEALAGTAPVAAAAAEDAEVVETTSDTVTEETARSSTEDFDSNISREPAQQNQTVQQEASDDDDDGLSTLEKALLVGAGALAVGAVLNNRRVVAASNDRVVVSGQDGGYQLIKDDNALLRQPGADVQTETFSDGSTRTTISYDDGSQVVTIRDADLRVVRRVRVTPDGQRVTLIDDLDQNIQPVDVSQLRRPEQRTRAINLNDEAALREALAVERDFDRAFSLSQVRNIAEVRQQVPAVDLDAITFDSGSAAIRPEQADELRELGAYIRETIADNPRAVFLVEGHTDAVGNAAYNLALSDRRAESVALALGEYFDVPTSNLVVQGYGERYLKVPTQTAERTNRRASVRNITPLLQVAAAN